MNSLVLCLAMVAQGPSAAGRDTLSNDRPEFPIGLTRDDAFLETVNQAAIRNPEGIRALMEEAAKEQTLTAIPSGTKAKSLAAKTLRGPLFKGVIKVEITDGPNAGLQGWVTSDSLMTGQEYQARKSAKQQAEAPAAKYKPLYRDPIAGEKAYLAPQPTMLGMIRHLIRVARADDSAESVFKEWQGATEATRDAILKTLESKKAIFFTTVNTEVKVQKVFPEQMINDIYPVQVEILTGPLKGRIGWVPVTVVSPVPGRAGKPPGGESTRTAEIQKTIDRRKQKAQARAKSKAAEDARAASAAAAAAAAAQQNPATNQAEVQLQILRQQAAIAEAQAATRLDNELTKAIRERRLRDAQLNGNGVYYTPNGAMTVDEFLRSRQLQP